MDASQIEQKWNNLYRHAENCSPAKVLQDNQFLLPGQGAALDLACGLGGNAILLAEHGLQTEAWDVSSVALEKLKNTACSKNLNISVKQCLIEVENLPKDRFDVIVISRFLDRTLSHEIMESLKKGGLLFYQTFVREKVSDSGPCNPDFLLARNELLQLFSPLSLLYYRENGVVGDHQKGDRNEAFFVAQKTS